MIHLYAIIDRPAKAISMAKAAPPMSGLEGSAVDVLPYNEIGAVVSVLATGKPLPIEANLWHHESVLEALMADHAVLPVRFGTVLADEAAVQTAMEEHYVEFVDGLAHVRGHVELSLRALWNDAAAVPPASGSAPTAEIGPDVNGSDDRFSLEALNHQMSNAAAGGRAYMMVQLEAQGRLDTQRRRAAELANEIHTPLARLAAESARRAPVTPRLLLTAAYLVKRDQVAAFRREVVKLSAAIPEVCLLCTGPWPPFSFVAMTSAQRVISEL